MRGLTLRDPTMVRNSRIFALDAAIIGLAPKRYYKAIESALPLADSGSLNLPSVSSSGTFAPAGVAGDDGRNYLLLANTGNVRTTYSATGAGASSTTTRTIVVLLKPTAAASGNKVFMLEGNGTNLRGEMYYDASNNQMWYFGGDAGASSFWSSPTSFVVPGAWHLYALRIDIGISGTHGRWYKDDVESTASPLGDAAYADATSRLDIGPTYAGGLGHMANWDTLLTTGNLTTIYNAAKTDGWAI